jgi:alpha-beta hydrolase superfamily lysophospholipase
MSARASSTATYLRVGGESVFGLFTEATRQAPDASAVLICPPFGWEEICSHRSRRDWSEQLAGDGHPTLRIDLPSTGNSGGAAHDPDRLSAWTAAVSAAAGWLHETTGRDRVAAIGIGLGGMLACNALAAGAPIDELVLWAAPTRGRALVRELHAFARMEDTGIDPSEQAASEQADAGTWAGGFWLSPQTTDALTRLDLAKLAFEPGRPSRALLLERDGMQVDTRLQEHLEAAGVTVTLAPGDGFGAMTAKPHLAVPPRAVFARVGAWLAQPSSAPAPGSGAATSVGASIDAAVRSEDTLELTVDGASMRETPWTLRQPCGTLFGILCEPAEPMPDAPCVVLLNAGAIRHVGPNRLWVETARRWAARGLTTLRVDLEGIGDSDGDAEQMTDLTSIYAPEYVEQLRAVLDALESEGVGRRFVLSGLCSGANWAFHGALLDERVTAAFMLNPRALFWDPSVQTARDYRRGLRRMKSWRAVLRGEVPLSRILTLAGQLPLALPRRALARRRARARGGDEVDRAFDRTLANGKHLRFLFSNNEPLREELELEDRLERPERWPNIGVDLLPGRVHTLRPEPAQRAASEALDRALDAELRRLAETDVTSQALR